MVLNFVLILIGFVLLIKGADFMVDGSIALARRAGVSELFIGLTIVAFGTSAPELAVSVQAALGNSGIAIGNVLGSNIANVALVLGFTAIFTTVSISKTTIKYEIPFVIIITIASVALLIEGDENLTFFKSVVLLCFLAIYFMYLLQMARGDKKNKSIEIEEHEKTIYDKKISMAIIATIGGIIAVVFGGKLVVESGTSIAKSFGVSEMLIGVTIVAIGTSLPELVTSVVAARKGKADLAVGNIIGSNILNLLLILGISGLVSSVSADRAIYFDSFFALGVIVLFYIISVKRKKIGTSSGIVLLSTYILYLILNIILG
jgi:cation:H+ antiporter